MITEESLAEFSRRVGRKLRISQNNELACKETIAAFCRGIGDENPLYCDEGYASKSPYGTVVAPPSWLYSVFLCYVQQGLPGVHAFHSGTDWEFYRPVLLGDRIRPECVFLKFEEKPSQFGGRMFMEYQEGKYFNQRGELAGKGISWLARVERSAAREKGKYAEIQLPHPWTESELKRIEEEVLGEKVRGAEPRYWEDVNVNDEIPPLVKGPFGVTDEIAFQAGTIGNTLLAHSYGLRYFRKHPAWGRRDPRTGSMEIWASVHWDADAAQEAGLPYAYDVGVQRQSWVMHSLTNWMGDHGWLKSNYVEYRRFVYLSDVVWLKGQVVRKYVDGNGEHCVDIETRAVNQRGEDTAPGHSTVILPSRETGDSPVRRRLPS